MNGDWTEEQRKGQTAGLAALYWKLSSSELRALAKADRILPVRGTMNQRGLCSKRGVMKVLVCAGLTLLAGERNSSAWQQSGADVEASAERGRKEFVQSCGFCHGADATGARGPDLMRSPLVAHDVKGDQIGPVIRQGRPDKGMPAMPLSDAQILDIAAFLHG